MTQEQIEAKKLDLKYTISVPEMLNRYGVKVKGNRSQGFCHNGKDLNMKVMERSCYCYVCNKKQDIFDIVQYFENCDFWTAFCLLGGNEEPSPQAIEKANKARKERERQIALEGQKKAELRQINSFITAYRNIIQSERPFSDLWCFAQNKLQFEIYKQEMVCLRNFRK